MLKRFIGVLVFIAILVFILTARDYVYSANNNTFIVNTQIDSLDANPGDGECADAGGNCSLRAAVMETNALAGADVIVLHEDTFNLTRIGAAEDEAITGDLDIIGELTINGAGVDDTNIDGITSEDRIFEIHSGATVTITGITIRKGDTFHTSGAGGGILNFGNTTISDSSITTNRAEENKGVEFTILHQLHLY